jgi:ribose transport system ATP-binding protein
VGAKAEIYEQIFDIVRQGITVIVSSAELPELMLLCDRTIVLYKGLLRGEFERDEMSKEKLLLVASGE